MSKKLAITAGSLVVLGSLLVPSLASASSLTNSQVNAIISLLQAFGADSTTIANVQTALGGGGSVTHSCQDFAGLKYGDFDTAPGGSVSQLQTWLGVASNSFGYGTYGPKTLSAWRARCNVTVTNTTSISAPFSISPASGAAPLAVTVSSAPIIAQNINLDFGDGTIIGCTSRGGGCTFGGQTHTYNTAGTYTAIIRGMESPNTVFAQTTVTVSTPTPSATLDESSLISSSTHPRITGTAHGVHSIGLSIAQDGGKFDGTGQFTTDAYGNWGVTLINQIYLPGSYQVDVYSDTNVLLKSDTLVVTTKGY